MHREEACCTAHVAVACTKSKQQHDTGNGSWSHRDDAGGRCRREWRRGVDEAAAGAVGAGAALCKRPAGAEGASNAARFFDTAGVDRQADGSRALLELKRA